MHEILRRLPVGAFVLDLGSRTGSFAASAEWIAVRVDAEVPDQCPRTFVAARAEALPFRNGQFAALISNHSLEHFEGLEHALDEIGRVIGPDSFLYIAVPDSSTLTDRIYRWMAHGGGHVNSFTSASGLARRVSEKTGLPHAGTRVLCTSLSFLNRTNIPGPIQKKLWLFCGGSERLLRMLTYAFRRLDRWFGTRLCIYGWACYFGSGISVETETWTNVCIRCGAGHPSHRLRKTALAKKRSFECPQCGAKNYFTPDEEYQFLH
jgi:SAM-dependent methyltransferase/DNA-directed RNA polymerase subunit RPC12/RpoP